MGTGLAALKVLAVVGHGYSTGRALRLGEAPLLIVTAH